MNISPFVKTHSAGSELIRLFGKLNQTRFHINIRPSFRARKSSPKTPQNDRKEIVRPWVKLFLHRYEQLKTLKERTGKPLSEIIQEAVSRFIRKKDYPISIAAISLSLLPGDIPPGPGSRLFQQISLFAICDPWVTIFRAIRGVS